MSESTKLALLDAVYSFTQDNFLQRCVSYPSAADAIRLS